MKKEITKEQLVKKSEDFPKWYTDVIIKSGLADYAPIKGCQVFKPYGYALWENIKNNLDKLIKKRGVKNAYFPIFIPEEFLKKEKQHVKGFSPELAVVTIGGGKKLKEKLIVRPTSETIIYKMYAQWIKSYRDLPLLINQWANIVRWEKRPRLFLRTTEFLWQEAHNVFQNEAEAIADVLSALDLYTNFYRDFLAIDGISGKKSETEKFPGAVATYSYEMLMPDRKVLQSCTSHNLGQNFSKAFNIKFKDKNGEDKFAWQSTWGLSSRSIGALIMVHGDDNGLIIPPKVAPIQIVIIPIFQKINSCDLEKKLKKIEIILKKFRIETDKRKEYSVGFKFNEWELKGVPLRIEIGEREIKENKITLARRDSGERKVVSFSSLAREAEKILESIQENLFKRSRKFLSENIQEVFDYKKFKAIMKNEKGLIKAFWCENRKCERRIKEETKATTRVLILNTPKEKGKCIYCGKEAERKWLFAQAY